MNTGLRFNMRYVMLRYLPTGVCEYVDSSSDQFNGQSDLLSSIEDYIHDDAEGTTYTVVDVRQGMIVAQRRIEVAKQAVRI